LGASVTSTDAPNRVLDASVCRTDIGGLQTRQCPAPADGELGRGGTIYNNRERG
jgi:hypothetical protein